MLLRVPWVALECSTYSRYLLEPATLYKNASLVISAIKKGVLALRVKMEVFVTNYRLSLPSYLSFN